MRRSEAINHIGKLVRIMGIGAGEYIGILKGISEDKPFRAFVKILWVLKYPYQYGHNANCIMHECYPPKDGEVVDNGAIYTYIYETEKMINYNDSLKYAINEYKLKCHKYIKDAEEGKVFNRFFGSRPNDAKAIINILEKHEKELIK